MSSLLKKYVPKLSGSMMDLHHLSENDMDQGFRESARGLIRRAFSSKKKKKKADKQHFPPLIKEPLRATRSNPVPDSRGFYFDSSPASDLAARRGVFSRRHYGSVELLISSDTDGSPQNAGRFRVETGDRSDKDEGGLSLPSNPNVISSPLNSPIHLENPEFQTRWYFKYFLGKLHQNYVGMEVDKEPFFLSVVVTDANNHNVPQYRAILWRKSGTQKICLSYNPNKPLTVKGILSHFDLEKVERGPKEIFNLEIQKELLLLEEQEGSVNFKFGVLFAKEGQSSDDEMYSNEHGSEDFDNFVRLLGEKIRLKSWEKYRGGLDVKNNTTGKESIYTVYEGHEIMFHISTMLPFSADNKQQVERKRHIGNDIANIVFVECDPNKTPSFRPSMMKTHFTHIFAVVTYSRENNVYRLNVFSEESVPLFGPPLPTPPVFTRDEEFRDFLLVKLINGEKAAFNTPVFAQKRQRTLDMLIKNLYQDHMPDTTKGNNMLNRRAFSDLIPDNPYGSRRKEEIRQVEFVRFGQTLKLKTILKGDAPTSLVTTGILKHQPWEPQCFLHDFHNDVICGDTWGDKLVVATGAGIFILEDGAVPRIIMDRSVAVKQLNVVEAHGLLVFRSDKGKDSKIHIFRLTDFEGEQNEDLVRTKIDCKDHKLERTKGCHLYALSRQHSSHLRMVVAVGRKLHVWAWKHSAAWTAWCPTVEFDTVEGFQFLRELQAFDVPQLITLIDGSRGDNQICVGYKNQFDLINEKNGDTLQLYKVDANKVNLVSAMDIYEDDEPELLLCYNHISHFQKLSEESSHQFDFHWNSEPKAIVCAFPYIMAFTPDTIEIRLIINGNLLHTMTMPKLFLISSKCDIYFSSTAPDLNFVGQTSTDRNRDGSPQSPPPSPSALATGFPANIYKISLTCLAGQISAERGVCAPPTSQPQTLLAPLVNTPDLSPRSPRAGKRSPLLRTKRLGPPSPFPHDADRYRHDSNSSSSDSGIQIRRTSDNSPPVSPYFTYSTSVGEDDVII